MTKRFCIKLGVTVGIDHDLAVYDRTFQGWVVAYSFSDLDHALELVEEWNAEEKIKPALRLVS